MTDSEYGAIVAHRLTGSEPLTDAGHPVGPDLSQFWAWSASDLVGNTARGVLAEFVVAHALGLTAGDAGITDGVRPDWTPWDLTTPSGIKIEVKSSAFIQSWEQRELSRPSFGIAPRRAWDPVTGTMNPEPQHHADVFVFALLAESNQASIDPLELSQWQFYVVPTRLLQLRHPGQRSLTLAAVQGLADPLYWRDLPTAVEQAVQDAE